MNDLISRKAVLKLIRESADDFSKLVYGMVDPYDLAFKVGHLPSAEPEGKKGHWINAACGDGTVAHKCSSCKRLVGYSVKAFQWCNFCPWCGADMRGEEEHE